MVISDIVFVLIWFNKRATRAVPNLILDRETFLDADSQLGTLEGQRCCTMYLLKVQKCFPQAYEPA